MMSSSSSTSFDQILESTQKLELRDAFKLLKSHACKVANFTLQWHDLEDHLRFIHSEIESKLQQYSAVKTIQNDANDPSKDLIFPQSKNPEANTSKASESKNPEGNTSKTSESKNPEGDTSETSESKNPEGDTSKTIESKNPGGTSKTSESKNPGGDTSKASESKNPGANTSKTSESKNPGGDTSKASESKNPGANRSKTSESKNPEANRSKTSESKNPESNTSKTSESKNPEANTSKTIECKNPEANTSKTSECKNPEAKTSETSEIPVKNGKELILYTKEHIMNRRFLQDYLFKLLKAVDKPGKLVLEAVKEFYSLADPDIRWSCIVVLEEFGRVREEEGGDVADEVREVARRFAVEWKGKLGIEDSSEVLGFLLLLIDFGLVGEFGFDEILKLFDCVTWRKQATELFRALGFADKASEYIQKLIAKNKRLEAVRFVYEFELVDQFPPVPLLKGHAKYAKNAAKEICKKGKYSFKAQSDATNSEIAALRGIIRFIKNYNLGSEYSSKMLRDQIQQMRKQVKELKANTETTGSYTQSQQNNGNKRSAPPPWLERRRIRRKKTVDLNDSVDISPPINSRQPFLHQPTTSFAGQGTQNSTPPPRTDAPSQAVPYTYAGATSNAHRQHSPTQAARLGRRRIRRKKMADLNASVDISSPTNSRQASLHQTTLFAGHHTQNSTPPPRTDAPSQAVPYIYVGATSKAHRQHSPNQAARLGRRRIRHKKTADLNASVDISLPINSRQASLHQPTTSFAGQGTQNSSPPPRTEAPSQAVPYTYVGATSNAHRQHSPNQAAHLLSDLSTAAHHLTSSFGNYPSASSTPITSYTSDLARPNQLAGSGTIHPHTSSSRELYERSVATNGSSGQFGLAGSATMRQHSSYWPGLYERGVTTNVSFCSSGQFDLATTHTPMAGASNASTNIFPPYYGDPWRTSMYSSQASSSNTGIAPSNTSFNRSGYHDRPVYSGGNYGVPPKFPPSIYHL